MSTASVPSAEAFFSRIRTGLGGASPIVNRYRRRLRFSQLSALGAGLLFDQLGERGRAEATWRRGVEILEPGLARDSL